MGFGILIKWQREVELRRCGRKKRSDNSTEEDMTDDKRPERGVSTSAELTTAGLRVWRGLSPAERRVIRRAIDRGEQVPTREQAVVAVVLAKKWLRQEQVASVVAWLGMATILVVSLVLHWRSLLSFGFWVLFAVWIALIAFDIRRQRRLRRSLAGNVEFLRRESRGPS
jgi:hypothetical protein